MELSAKTARAIRVYEPVKTEGLTLYPILMQEYESFLRGKAAISFLARSLPLEYLSQPLLSAFYRMDMTAMRQGEEPSGMFYRSLLFLALSLRLGEGKGEEERIKLFRVAVDRERSDKLLAVEAETEEGETIRITPVMFQRLRPILAAQNGIELLSEDTNPDLLEAERDIAQQRGPKLDYRVDSLISTVAALSGRDERELEDWPILKFQRRQEALERVLNFLICGVGETQGTKWKKGNPYPSPFFDRLREDSAALVSLESYAGGAGLQAVQNAGSGAAPAAPILEFPMIGNAKGANTHD